jgi:hypothetical protein
MEKKFLKYAKKFLSLKQTGGYFEINDLIMLDGLSDVKYNKSYGYIVDHENITEDKVRFPIKIIHPLSLSASIKNIRQENIRSCMHMLNIDDILELIRAMTVEERKYILDNNLQNIFIKYIYKRPEKIFICMALMTGLFRWEPSPETIRTFLRSTKQQLQTDSPICCYDAVVYACYLANITTKEKLIKHMDNYREKITGSSKSIKRIESEYGITLKDNFENVKRIYRRRHIFDVLGCNTAIEINSKNVETNLVKVCFTGKRLRRQKDFDIQNSDIEHYFLSYRNFAIEINQSFRGSPECVSLCDFTGLMKKYNTELEDPNTREPCTLPCYFGDIHTLITNLSR